MQRVSIRRFNYDQATSTLAEDASSLTGELNLSPLLNQMEHFEVVGARETKRYGWAHTVREKATNEVGDILAWHFRPINALGRYQPGPTIIIFND